MSRARRCAVFVLISSLALAMGCGSDSGSRTSLNASIRVTGPQEATTFAAGDAVPYMVETENFALAAPFDRRTLNVRDHGDDEGAEGEGSADEHSEDEHSEDESHASEGSEEESMHDDEAASHEEADHEHEADETNPVAREGHYHIYLDSASGSDPHITTWESHGDYVLPQDIEVGTHTLRFELRDNNHVRVGTANAEDIIFFTVK